MPNLSHPITLSAERCQRIHLLYQQGWKPDDIAEMLSVSSGTVSRCLQQPNLSVIAAAPEDPAATLTPHQFQQLLGLLSQGPATYNLPGQRWTNKGISALIDQTFGVSMDAKRISHLFRTIGWHFPAETRAHKAWELKKQGATLQTIADQLTIPLVRVQRWWASSDSPVGTAQSPRRALSGNSKLTIDHLHTLAELLRQPPQTYGFSEKKWTRKTIRALIDQHYGITISVNHVPYLLRRMKRVPTGRVSTGRVNP